MNKVKKKTLLLMLALSAVLLLPMGVSAQTGGGVFYRGDKAENVDNFSLFDRGLLGGGFNLFNQQFGEDEEGGYELYNQTFGQDSDTPLGSGLLILVAAGAGYAFKKRKNNYKK